MDKFEKMEMEKTRPVPEILAINGMIGMYEERIRNVLVVSLFKMPSVTFTNYTKTF